MLYLNAIVSRPNGSSYGVVTKLHGHYTHADDVKALVTVHHINPTTGEKMACPDARCNGKKDACPIHQYTTEAHRLTPWPRKDIAFYMGEGMLSPTLAHEALKTTYSIARLTANKFRVYKNVEGMTVDKATVTNEDADDLWQTAIALTSVTDPFGSVVINPGHKDYDAFAARFND